jgi:hypothetical protein
VGSFHKCGAVAADVGTARGSGVIPAPFSFRRATVKIELISEMFQRSDGYRVADNNAWWNGEADRDLFMVGRKSETEIWLLGRFVDAYNDNTSRKLIWGERREAPDFAVFDEGKNLVCHIEVTEWLDPDRRRDDEYKSTPISKAVPVPDEPELRDRAIDHLCDQLTRKFRKAREYQANTWLLISVNVLYSLFWGLKDAQGEAEARIVASLLETIGAEIPETISQIWILPPLRGLETVVNRVYPTGATLAGNWLTRAA